MKKKNIVYALLLGASILGVSCSDGFDSINTNPNDPTGDMYDFSKGKLGKALRNGAVYNDADIQQRVKALGADVFAHYVSGAGSNWQTRNYVPTDSWSSLYWNTYYSSWLAELNMIIVDADIYPNRENTKALARIWRVYMQSMITDNFGSIPFPLSPADTKPDYMPLKEQYKIYFTELDEAVKSFDSTKPFLTFEDWVYGGSIDKWKRFANSLRLRLAIKLSEIDPALCGEQAQAALKADMGIIESNADNAVVGSTSGWGKQYPYYLYQQGWGDRQTMMSSMEKILTNIGGIDYNGAAKMHPAKVDPRGTKYFDTSVKGDAWRGMNTGIETITDEMKASVSAMSITWILKDNTRKTEVLTYPEICFLMAEAVERGFVAGQGTAKEWYEKGVKASFSQWSLGDLQSLEYLASNEKNLWGTSANYDDVSGAGNTALEKIITQKYIASYPDLSFQVWNDKRRLNLPAFDIPLLRNTSSGTYPSDGDIQNVSNFISRLPYPQNEFLINRVKYETGVAVLNAESSTMGGDKTSTPLWWASKRSNYNTSVK
ncbi:MAG: hypothetical protein RL662_1950 [Bacteroidota bacterium]|jgi:hypothetical protein